MDKCIESWKRYCPDYEIKEWNEQNYDVNKIPYVRDAYKEKKWAFVADYVRLDVVWKYGGLYLDTDVELIKPLDYFLQYEQFFAIEKYNANVATGLGFGAIAGSEILKQLLDVYKNISFYKEDGNLNLISCVKYTTDYFVTKGYCIKDVTQKCNGATIFSSEYFCPMNFKTGKVFITENTYGIHWYEASWFPASDKKIYEMELKIKEKYPDSVARMLCFLYRNGYRLLEYTSKGILSEKIKLKLKKIRS